jgi:acyl-CoA synthetase (AMP-forming)/AMP-acid ligase II
VAVPGKTVDKESTENGIYRILSERSAKWQLPDNIIFVKEIEKTSVGKADKTRLKRDYERCFAVEFYPHGILMTLSSFCYTFP